jgi:pimeloyl-ACP methyl ester carboxylesterase
MRKMKRYVILFLLLLTSFSFYQGLSWFFPLEVSHLSTRFELWRNHVEEIQKDGFHGYVKNGCQKTGIITTPECTCVAFIHGLGDDALTWKKILLFPENEWKKLGLNHSLRLFAMDLPGAGRTPPATDLSQYRVRKQAEALNGLLGSSCSEWVVVGNSLGGWIAIWLALDWPQRVSRLVVLDSAGLKNVKSQLPTGLSQPTVDSLKEFQRKAYYRPRPIPERVWSAIVARAQGNQAVKVMESQVEEDELDLRLASLRRPILLLWGKEDRVIPISIGYQMRSLIPAAVWREVSECGHLPQKECPVPVIRAIIEMIQFGAV